MNNPDLLPKIRSSALMRSCATMPCSLRLASFAGMSCAPQNTVVGCHIPTIGKGVGTKVSDLFVAAGCRICHAMLDGSDPRGMTLAAAYPAAWQERIMRAHHETMSRWVAMGLISVEDGEIV